MEASFKDPKITSKENVAYLNALSTYIEESFGTPVDKFENFPKFATRTSITRFLARYEIFKKVLNVQGSIVECGVLFGGGLMTWAQLSSILEPANHQRRVIGFDTFAGFPSISAEDRTAKASSLMEEGGHSVEQIHNKATAIASIEEDLKQCIALYNRTRYFNHIDKVELIKGDVCKTAYKYVIDNPHLVVSLLYLDVDLHEPTRKALELFVPRIPRGGIIAFDELNSPLWAGETIAVVNAIGIHKLKLERFQFGTGISYAVVGE